jgi:hypothetical protein
MLENEEQEEGEYDRLLREMGDRSKGQLGGADYLSSKIPQNQAAETLRLGLQSGLPLDTVFRNLEQTKQEQTRLPAGEYERLLREAPATAGFAKDPYRLAAGREDLPNLERIEQLSKGMVTPVYKPMRDTDAIAIIMPEAKRRAAEDFAKQEKDKLQNTLMTEGLVDVAPYKTQVEMEDAYADKLYNEFRRNEKFMSGDTSKTSFLDRTAAAFSVGMKRGQQTNQLGYAGSLKASGQGGPEVARQIAQLEKELSQQPMGEDFASRWLFQFAKLLGQMKESTGEALPYGATGGAAGSVLPGVGTAAGAGVGLTGGFAQDAFLVEGGNAYVELSNITGKNGEKLDENTKRVAAGLIGSINAGLEMVGFKFFTAPFKSAARRMIVDAVKDAVIKPTFKVAIAKAGKEWAKSVAAETATEVIQEGVNILGEEAAKAAANGEFEGAKGEQVVARLFDIFSETLRGAALMGLGGPTVNLAMSRRNAQTTQQTLKEIDKAVSQTKLAESNPQEIEKIIADTVKDTKGEFLHVQAAPYAQHLQSRGIDPIERMVQLTGSGEQMKAALPDGDVQIPLAKYALMDEAERAFMQDEARRDPADLSERETKELVKLAEDIQKKEEAKRVRAEKTAEQKAKDEVFAAGAARVREVIERAVGEAGFKREAKTYGQFIEAAFKRFGQRSGIDPFELFKEYGLEVAVQPTPQPTTEQTLEQPAPKEPRGRIRIGKNRSMSIDLFEGKDRSTVLHEVGHFYLETLADLSERVGAPADIKEDLQTVMDWLGVKNRSEITTDQHEKWAKGFEQYLMEGKAPSKELRKAFFRFREWLTAIYREMREYFNDVNLTDDVRGVMDRLLASEDQIEAAQAEQAAVALIPDVAKAVEDGILTVEQGAKYAQAIKESQDAVRDRYVKRVMADVLREDQAWWKEEREKLRPEVSAEIDKRAEYKALYLMRDGTKPDGSALDEGVEQFKLARAALNKILPDDAKLPPGVVDTAFPAGLGVDPAFAAGVLGFETPQAMFDALETARLQSREDAINQELDYRMQKLHGEPMTQQEAKLEAENALHGEDRAKILRMELEFLASQNLATLKGLNRAVSRRMPSQENLRKDAEKAIGRLDVEAIVPTAWAMAERRAAKEAVTLLNKGDIGGAFDAKLRELINHERYIAAKNARDSVAKKLKDWNKLKRSEATLAKSRDVDLVNAAKAILGAYEVKGFDKQPGAFLKQLAAYDPEVHQAILALIGQATDNAKHYKKVTYDQFKEMATAVDSLWDLAKNTRTMEVEGRKVDVEEAMKPLIARLKELGQQYKGRGLTGELSALENTKIGLLGIKAALRRVEAWADAMGDSFKKTIWRPINDAVTGYREERIKNIRKYLEIVKTAKDTFDTKPIEAPELQGSKGQYIFKNKAELLAALLHTGNESNLMKLLVGYGWGETDMGGNIDISNWRRFEQRMWREGILTKADYQFVQSIWDLFEEIKPGAQKAHKEMFGHYFKEITADTLQTPWGEFRGGYVPAKVDPSKFTAAETAQMKEVEHGFNASYTYPTTYKGFTQARSAGFAKPLLLNLNLIPQHIDQVLRFTHIKPRVNDLLKLLKHKEFSAEMDGHDPKAIDGMLVPWLDRTVKQKTEQSTLKEIDWILRAIRRNTGMQFMVGNIANAAQNITGIPVALTKVRAKHLMPAVWEYLANRHQTSADVTEKSAFMRHLLDAQVQDMLQDIEEIQTNPNTFQKVKAFTDKHGQFFQKAIQNPVNIITWVGAYDQALASDKNMTEAEAVQMADEAVRLTQGAFGAEHMARYEAGNTFAKLFTMFTSYFSMKSNLVGTEFMKAARSESGFRGKSARMLYVYLMGIAIPAILAKAIAKSLRGQWNGDDDDGYLDDVMETLFLSQAQEGAAMVPVAGQALNVLLSRFTETYSDDRLSISPASAALESGLKSNPLALFDGSASGRAKKRAIRDALSLIGAATGLPLGPLAKPIGLAIDDR